MAPPPATEARPALRVWDGPTRLCKWSLVALVALGWLSARHGDVTLVWHRLNGYALLTLTLFRMLWALAGPPSASWRSLLAPPRAALGQVLMFGRRPRARWLGHTPLGGWMAAALLVLLLGQGVSGLFTADSNGVFGGPFAATDPLSDPSPTQARLAWVHHHAYDLLLALVAVHAGVAVFHQLVRRDELIRAMWTGRKPSGAYLDIGLAPTPPSRWGRAAACLAIAAAVVLGAIRLAGGDWL